MAIKVYNVYTKGMRVSDGFFTAPELIVDAGKFIPEYGGYYTGANIYADSTEYMVIVAPKSGGEASRAGRTSDTITNGAWSFNDSKNNMDILVSLGISNFPAAEFCYNLDLNGFTDWHMPSHHELEIAYRYLKPSIDDNDTRSLDPYNAPSGTNPSSNPSGSAYTVSDPQQTNVALFQSGGSEAFNESFYIASYFYEASGSANGAIAAQLFLNGLQAGRTIDSTQNVRAFRWEEVI